MSYNEFVSRFGTDRLTVIISNSTVKGRSDWVRGSPNAPLEQAIRNEFALTRSEWLRQPVCLGCPLLPGVEFSKEKFEGVVWSDIVDNHQYWKRHSNAASIVKALKIHNVRIDLSAAPPLPEDALMPDIIGGSVWALLFKKGITTRSALQRACNSYGTVEITGAKFHPFLVRYLEDVGLHPHIVIVGDIMYLNVEEWGSYKYSLLTSPIPFLAQLDIIEQAVVNPLSKYKDLKSWREADFFVPLYIDDSVRSKLKRLAEEVKSAR